MYKWIMLVISVFLIGVCSEMGTSIYNISDFNENQQDLIKAIQQHDVEKVKKLIPRSDIKSFSRDNVPLLTVAFFEAHDDKSKTEMTPKLQIISELVKAGAIFDEQGRFPSAPIILATANENAGFLLAMIRGGLSPNYRHTRTDGKLGHNIIFEIVSNPDLNSLKVLIREGADIEVKDSLGDTPTSEALITNIDACYYLIFEHNTNTNITDVNGRTFLSRVDKGIEISKEAIIHAQARKDSESIKQIKDGLIKLAKIRERVLENQKK